MIKEMFKIQKNGKTNSITKAEKEGVMLLVLFLLGAFFIILLVLIILFATSIVEVGIYDIEKSSLKKEKIKGYLKIRVLFCGIPWLSIKMTEEKIKESIKKLEEKKWDIQKIEQRLLNKDQIIESLKGLKVEFKDIYLFLRIGLEDVFVTSAITTLVATSISILLPIITKKTKLKNIYYKITPVYNQNLYEIQFHCIIRIKMVHIIYVIYNLMKKKGRSDEHERTSNRESYDYSYGQH